MNSSSGSYQQEGSPRIITNEKPKFIPYLVLGRQAVELKYISLQKEHHTR
jgi:hypothetical protein